MDTSTFDEEGVRLLLTGDDEDVRHAMSLIHQHLQRPLTHWLRRRLPGLSSEALAQTWSELLIQVMRAAQANQFDSSRALLPWLCSILTARAIDKIRRKGTHTRTLRDVARTFEGKLHSKARSRLDASECQEVMELIREAIATLPTQQRLVFQAYADHFPDSRRMQFLRQEVSERSGEPQTLASIKRALQEGRRKVKAFLRRKGYSLDGGAS